MFLCTFSYPYYQHHKTIEITERKPFGISQVSLEEDIVSLLTANSFTWIHHYLKKCPFFSFLFFLNTYLFATKEEFTKTRSFPWLFYNDGFKWDIRFFSLYSVSYYLNGLPLYVLSPAAERLAILIHLLYIILDHF